MPTDAKICYTHCFHPKISVHCHFEGNNLMQVPSNCDVKKYTLVLEYQPLSQYVASSCNVQTKWIYMAVYL